MQQIVIYISLIHFPTMKTPYTYTRIAITPHNSALHNTILHTNFVLWDRQLYSVERSRISWWWT